MPLVGRAEPGARHDRDCYCTRVNLEYYEGARCVGVCVDGLTCGGLPLSPYPRYSPYFIATVILSCTPPYRCCLGWGGGGACAPLWQCAVAYCEAARGARVMRALRRPGRHR